VEKHAYKSKKVEEKPNNKMKKESWFGRTHIRRQIRNVCEVRKIFKKINKKQNTNKTKN